MTQATHPTLLFHLDPARNMARFYLLAVEPTLFGGSSLTRCWGRMGTKGQMKIDLFDTAVEAREASRRCSTASSNADIGEMRKIHRNPLQNRSARRGARSIAGLCPATSWETR